MFMRMRWFVLGVAATVGVGAYLVEKLRRAREKLTPENMLRAGADAAADLMGAFASRISPR